MPRNVRQLNNALDLLIKGQRIALETALRGKTIHGVYRQTLELEGIDRKSSTLWLQDGE